MPSLSRRCAMKRRIAFLFSFLSLFLIVATADSYQIIRVNLPTIVSKSEVAFKGKCESFEVKKIYPPNNPQGLIVTHYVFSVADCLKGECGSRFEYDQWGAPKREAKALGVPYAVGFAQFNTGSDYVVFWTSRTKLGLRAPMGMQQGVFKVDVKDGRETVVNSFSNSNLFKGLPKTQTVSKALKAANIDENSPPSGPMLYDDFKKVVDMLK